VHCNTVPGEGGGGVGRKAKDAQGSEFLYLGFYLKLVADVYVPQSISPTTRW
jgi:hypothetical protein